jgi:hypothetical protein
MLKSLMDRLLPHLSSEMPRVADSLPWFVWLDALLFVCTVLGVVSLIYCEVRLTKESSKTSPERFHGRRGIARGLFQSSSGSASAPAS